MMNSSQMAVCFEEAVKRKLREYLTRKFVGFDAVYVPRSTKMLHFRVSVTRSMIRAEGFRAGLNPSNETVDELMAQLKDQIHAVHDVTYVAHNHKVVEWLADVTVSMERQGMPFMNDPQQMNAAYEKARAEREMRKGIN